MNGFLFFIFILNMFFFVFSMSIYSNSDMSVEGETFFDFVKGVIGEMSENMTDFGKVFFGILLLITSAGTIVIYTFYKVLIFLTFNKDTKEE